jgi:hypothetical protein
MANNNPETIDFLVVSKEIQDNIANLLKEKQSNYKRKIFDDIEKKDKLKEEQQKKKELEEQM